MLAAPEDGIAVAAIVKLIGKEIPPMSIDGVETAELEYEAYRRRGSRRPGYPPGNRAHWPGTPLVNNYRGPTVAPHNAYRTHPGGYNDWCVIVCQSDEEWQRLVQVMGAPEWAVSPPVPSPSGEV